MDFYPQGFSSLTGERLRKTEELLERSGLRFMGGADFTAQLVSDEGELVGTGSLCGNVLKYIAIDERLRGEGAALTLVSELVSEAYRRGITKLFLFTKAANEMLFRGVGFYTLASTRDVCFMENTRSGLSRWLASVPRLDGTVGACVMNCNPFTNGHRYLIETAAGMADSLYVFVVSEDESEFSFDDRFALVKAGTADLKNVTVLPSGEYMISRATFPTYFLKEGADAESVWSTLDLTLFAEKIAPALNIRKRFVGTEPYCAVTRNYNGIMKDLLPRYGIEVREIERMGLTKQKGDKPPLPGHKAAISASRVREAIAKGDTEVLKKLVPQTTYDLIRERYFPDA
jgi:[citrate (pro-3S)-lyase] ligase